MAPQLKDNWQQSLKELMPGWSSYKDSPITNTAIETLGSFFVVPTMSGGIQLEVHRDGIDFELEINPDGTLGTFLIGRSK